MQRNDSDTVILGEFEMKWNEDGILIRYRYRCRFRLKRQRNHNHNHNQYQGHWMRSRLILVESVTDVMLLFDWLVGCSMWCVFEWLACVWTWPMEMSVIWMDSNCGSFGGGSVRGVSDRLKLYCPLMRLGHWYLFESRDNMMSILLPVHSWIGRGNGYHFGVHNNYEHSARPETEQQKSCENVQLGHWLDLTPLIVNQVQSLNVMQLSIDSGPHLLFAFIFNEIIFVSFLSEGATRNCNFISSRFLSSLITIHLGCCLQLLLICRMWCLYLGHLWWSNAAHGDVRGLYRRTGSKAYHMWPFAVRMTNRILCQLLIDACSTLTSLRKWRRILIHSPGLILGVV